MPWTCVDDNSVDRGMRLDDCDHDPKPSAVPVMTTTENRTAARMLAVRETVNTDLLMGMHLPFLIPRAVHRQTDALRVGPRLHVSADDRDHLRGVPRGGA